MVGFFAYAKEPTLPKMQILMCRVGSRAKRVIPPSGASEMAREGVRFEPSLVSRIIPHLMRDLLQFSKIPASAGMTGPTCAMHQKFYWQVNG